MEIKSFMKRLVFFVVCYSFSANIEGQIVPLDQANDKGSNATEVEKDRSGLLMELKNKFQNYKILVEKSCPMGDSRVDSVGMLIERAKVDSSLQDENNLAILIAKFIGNKWIVHELPREAKNQNGSSPDILSDYTRGGKFSGNYDIRCTIPDRDKDVSVKARGEWKGNFKELNFNHLCYSASDVYNSWACYVSTKDGGYAQSFVQFNAD